MYIYIYIYIYNDAWRRVDGGTEVAAGHGLMPALPVSVKKTLLLCEPLPCNTSAETAIQPLNCCFNETSHMSSSPEECFFTDTGCCRSREATEGS